MGTNSILSAKPGQSPPSGWMNTTDGGLSPQYIAPKITKHAKEIFDNWVASYTKPPGFDMFFYYGPDLGVAYGRRPYGTGFENRYWTGISLPIKIITVYPSGSPAKDAKSIPGNEMDQLGRAGLIGIANAMLNKASAIGQAFFEKANSFLDMSNASTRLDSIDNLPSLASGTAMSAINALLFGGTPLPPDPAGPPPASFLLICGVSEAVEDPNAPASPDNEIWPPGDGGGGGGGGGGDRGTWPDPDSFLDTANRLAKLLQSMMDIGKTAFDRLSFVNKLADVLDSVGKTLGALADVGDFLRDMLKDSEGEDLTGQELEDALVEILPIIGEVVNSIVSEIFKNVKDSKKPEKTTDDKPKKVSADETWDKYFISEQGESLATGLRAITAAPFNESYEIEF